MHKQSVFLCALMIAVVVGLIGVAKFKQLGSFAKSPQTVQLMVGARTTVAGGRASVWFSDVNIGPRIEVTHKDKVRFIDFANKDEIYEAFGLGFKLIELIEDENGNKPTFVKFEVTWDESGKTEPAAS